MYGRRALESRSPGCLEKAGPPFSGLAGLLTPAFHGILLCGLQTVLIDTMGLKEVT